MRVSNIGLDYSAGPGIEPGLCTHVCNHVRATHTMKLCWLSNIVMIVYDGSLSSSLAETEQFCCIMLPRIA